MHTRRRFLLTASASLLAPQSSWALPHRWLFDVKRNGSLIGEHQIITTGTDEKFQAHTHIEFRVGFGPVTFYRYDHDIKEIWNKGRLQQLIASTNRNGRKTDLNFTLEDNNFKGSVNGQTTTRPYILPTAYWNMALPGSQQLLETQDGKVFQVNWTKRPASIVHQGTVEAATIWTSTGDLKITLTTTPTYGWSGMSFLFKDAEFVYEPRQLGRYFAL